MKNFEVGERVQFVEDSEVKTGKVVETWIEGIGKAYQVETNEGKIYFFGENKIAKLDQPEPVKVPEQVSKLLDTHLITKEPLDDFSKGTILTDILDDYSEGVLSEDWELADNWIGDNRTKLIDAVRNGYVVEEAKNWIVSIEYHDGQYDVRYFHSFAGRTSKEDFPSVVSVKKRAYRFTEKEKADAVAVLINGTVEEVEAE